MNADDDTTPKPRHLRPLVGTFIFKKILVSKFRPRISNYPQDPKR